MIIEALPDLKKRMSADNLQDNGSNVFLSSQFRLNLFNDFTKDEHSVKLEHCLELLHKAYSY